MLVPECIFVKCSVRFTIVISSYISFVFVSYLAQICVSIIPDVIVNLPKKCPLWPGPSNWGWEPDRSPHPSPRTPHPLPISHKTIYQENCFFYNPTDCEWKTLGIFCFYFFLHRYWLLLTHPPLDVCASSSFVTTVSARLTREMDCRQLPARQFNKCKQNMDGFKVNY